jgi:dihydrofolate reductase
VSEVARPRIALVVAMDSQRAIGRGNALPWHLPDDLKRFKALTLDQTILMGRRTAESLGRALPRRRNMVLTQSGAVPFAGMESIASIDQTVQHMAPGETLYVIGGGKVYAQMLPLADVLHLTMVDCVVSGADTFFPAFDESEWKVQSRLAHAADERHAHAFEFVDLVRR